MMITFISVTLPNLFIPIPQKLYHANLWPLNLVNCQTKTNANWLQTCSSIFVFLLLFPWRPFISKLYFDPHLHVFFYSYYSYLLMESDARKIKFPLSALFSSQHPHHLISAAKKFWSIHVEMFNRISSYNIAFLTLYRNTESWKI